LPGGQALRIPAILFRLQGSTAGRTDIANAVVDFIFPRFRSPDDHGW